MNSMTDMQLDAVRNIMMGDVLDVPYSKESRDAVIMKMADIVSELVSRELNRAERERDS